MKEKSLRNLQLLKGTNDSKTQAERGRKGGKAKTLTKTLSYYAKKKCKHCKLPCPLKEKGKEEEWKCKVPDAKRLILESVSNPSKLNESLIMDAMRLQSMSGEDFKKSKDTFYVKLNLKKELFPNVERVESMNLNVNVDLVKFENLLKKYSKREK
jgi:hypothetical protein